MDAQIVSKVISYRRQRWRLNSDGSWSVLVFGTTYTNQDMHWSWMDVDKNKVPKDVLKAAK